MDDYVEQNDVSNDVSHDELFDASTDDSDEFEIDEVKADETICSFDDTIEKNGEFKESSITFETDNLEENVGDIPEDTINEDDTLEECTEEFLEDSFIENDSESKDECGEILEDTFTEEELFSKNEQENFGKDAVDEEKLVTDSSSSNSENYASEDFDENDDQKDESNDELEEKVLFETETEEFSSELGGNEISAEVNDKEESGSDNTYFDSVDFLSEDINFVESETMDSQDDKKQEEVTDDAISNIVNIEIGESDVELENATEFDGDSDTMTDDTSELQNNDSAGEVESNIGFETDEVVADENDDTVPNIETGSEQDVDADKISHEDSDVLDEGDAESIDISQDADGAEVNTDTIDVNDGCNSEQSLRDRIIHPSFGQTVKIARNMGDTLKADDEGYQTVKGYRVGKAGHLVNSVASSVAKLPKGQTLVGKTVIDSVAHSFDSGYANLHPEERFDFKTLKEVSAEEYDSHTLEFEMSVPSYEIDESAFETGNTKDQTLNSVEYKARIDVTPINKGAWLNENGEEGIRGESKWCPDDIQAQRELKKFGVNGIEYKNGYPDFTSVSFFGCNLEENDFLDSDRTQFDGCNFTLLNEIEEDTEFAKLYNFDDEQMEDLESGKTPYGYTWHHDTNEKGFMLLVPTSIHQACRHSGGRSSWGGGSKNR